MRLSRTWPRTWPRTGPVAASPEPRLQSGRPAVSRGRALRICDQSLVNTPNRLWPHRAWASQIAASGLRLRRGYLDKDELQGSAPRLGPANWGRRGAFTLGGHRDPSLYRTAIMAGKSKQTLISSLLKYPGGLGAGPQSRAGAGCARVGGFVQDAASLLDSRRCCAQDGGAGACS